MDPRATDLSESSAFLWTVPGLDLRVTVAKAVLGELRARLETREPAEFGGVLLGHIESDETGHRTHIEAFEPLVIQHRYGPSYTLSNLDRRQFERLLHRRRRKNLVPIGFFRSHVRRGLYLDQKDFDLIRDYFRHPAAVCLLVRRDEAVTARGAFFVWEDNDMRRHESYSEFPLEATLEARPEAPQASLPEAPLAAPVAAPLAASTALAMPPAMQASGPPAWLRPAAVVLLGAALPIAAYYGGRAVALSKHGDGTHKAAEVARRVSAPIVQSPKSVQAPVPPLANAPNVAQPETPLPSNSRDRTVAVAPPLKSARRRIEIDPQAPVTHADLSMPDAPAVAPASGTAAPPAIFKTPAPAPAPRTDKVVAFIKPVDRNRQGIRKIPLLRSLAGSGDSEDFVPANPLSHPLPPVPDGEIADGENSVELTARIDRGGSVARVKYSDGNHRLTKVSANALSHWRFEPARQNGEAVESEMVVRFEFRKKP